MANLRVSNTAANPLGNSLPEAVYTRVVDNPPERMYVINRDSMAKRSSSDTGKDLTSSLYVDADALNRHELRSFEPGQPPSLLETRGPQQ